VTHVEARSQAERVKQIARACGFSRAGVAPAAPDPADLARLDAWVATGLHGTLAWLARDTARRADPRRVLPGARSVVMLAVDYDSGAPRSTQVASRDDEGEPLGWISRYAWGDDYHEVVGARLRALVGRLQAEVEPAASWRWYVDTGPVLERALAARAGLGWIGKHTILVHPDRGSFFFLAAVLTTALLEPDSPTPDHCGTCTACLDACPTHALTGAHVLDARLCISTLTIETRGPLPDADRPKIGRHLFGCDICQDVCPFNRFSRPSGEAAFEPRDGLFAPRLSDVERMDTPTYERLTRRSALKRRKLQGLRDNAAAARANTSKV